MLRGKNECGIEFSVVAGMPEKYNETKLLLIKMLTIINY